MILGVDPKVLVSDLDPTLLDPVADPVVVEPVDEPSDPLTVVPQPGRVPLRLPAVPGAIGAPPGPVCWP
jgi:hypothetical protein